MSNSFEYKELLLRGLKGQLSKSEESKLIEALKKSPELALEWNVSTGSIPSLIENCHELALEILVSLKSSPKKAE